MTRFIRASVPALITLMLTASAASAKGKAMFPETRPDRASYPRPLSGERLDVSPPAFTWWRAGERGEVLYRLRISDAIDPPVYESPIIEDPAHAPDRALPAGDYTWTVEALDKQGAVLAVRAAQPFTINPGALEQPFIPAAELLSRVPREHPRLIFPAAQLDEIRATLTTTRKEAYARLKSEADRALKLKIPDEPDYDEIEDHAKRRLAYKETFGRLRKYHQSGMGPLALMYLMSGEEKYGEHAKAILLGAAKWDPEGISSVLAPYGDEVGLSIAKAGAQTYDWTYDLYNDDERALVEKMLAARADQMMRRLVRKDYLHTPEESHNGRLPGYIIEHAICLADHPRAETWMDYGMRVYLTVFPHWAGREGGWAEGVSYGLAYNTIYLMPFESLRNATGFDLWQRPFYNKVRHFFMYNISPVGDIAPWGDTEHSSAMGKSGSINSLLRFHANRFNDPTVRWYCDLLRTPGGGRPSVGSLPGLILADEVKSAEPVDLPNDAAFRGVGWAALHSDIRKPTEDLMVMFKSSPFGGVSHSHADQNSFAIMQGGKSLAIPAGERYPFHGTPFHTQYTQLTMAHNAVLIDGKGQVNRDGNRGGELVDFQTTEAFGYVVGDAANCFGKRAKTNLRHMLLMRPNVVIVVDELETPKAASFQWLLHSHNQFELGEGTQSLVSRKKDVSMNVALFTDGGFDFTQEHEWPFDPKKGYPTASKPSPKKQWHFTASTREKADARMIVAVMTIAAGDKIDVKIARKGDEIVVTHGASTARIRMSGGPVLEASSGNDRLTSR